MNTQFYEDMKRVMAGQLEPEKVINKIEKVAGALVDALFKDGKIELDGTTLETLCNMGIFVSVFAEENTKLQSILYALVKSAVEMN